jgi:hypothetical protein
MEPIEEINGPESHDKLWKFGNQKKFYQDAMCDYS